MAKREGAEDSWYNKGCSGEGRSRAGGDILDSQQGIIVPGFVRETARPGLLNWCPAENLGNRRGDIATIGQERVRVGFNPSGNEAVDLIKAETARLIDFIQVKGKDSRLKDLSQTAYEEAAMWAVKAATA